MPNLTQPRFTNEAVIACCKKCARFLSEIQTLARLQENFGTQAVRQECNPLDYRLDPVTIASLRWDQEVQVAALDAFCHFINKEQMLLLWSCRLNNLAVKPAMQALVLRPSLAFREHRGRRDLVENGNVDYIR